MLLNKFRVSDSNWVIIIIIIFCLPIGLFYLTQSPTISKLSRKKFEFLYNFMKILNNRGDILCSYLFLFMFCGQNLTNVLTLNFNFSKFTDILLIRPMTPKLSGAMRVTLVVASSPIQICDKVIIKRRSLRRRCNLRPIVNRYV